MRLGVLERRYRRGIGWQNIGLLGINGWWASTAISRTAAQPADEVVGQCLQCAGQRAKDLHMTAPTLATTLDRGSPPRPSSARVCAQQARWPRRCARGLPRRRLGAPTESSRAPRCARQAAAARPGRAPARSRARRSSRSVSSPPTACTKATSIPALRVIAGIGRVSGRQAMIVCNDATVKGGTYYPLTVKKHLRAQEIAQENRLPCIYLVDSGGANLPHQAEVFPDRDHFGRIFFNQANMSALGIPQIACVMGSCTAGGAYVPAMSGRERDRAQSGHDLSGRPAAGQSRDGRGDQRRGSGRGGHSRAKKSGVVDHLAENDEHALTIVRDIVSTCPRGGPSGDIDLNLRDPRPPRYDAEDLYAIDPCRRARALRRPRGDRPAGRRVRVPRVQGALRLHAGLRLSPISGASRSRSWPTTACCSAKARSRARTSSSSPASGGFRCCSSRTSPASWSAANTRRKASPSTAPSWSLPSPPPACPSSRC